MAVCFVLFSLKLNGSITSVSGCGGEGGCAQVMGGRWSEWFHIPVTFWAGLVYLGIAFLTLPPLQQSLGRTGDQLLAAGGVVLAGAALYFLSLLFLDKRVGGFCPWCLGLHITGLTVAGMILAVTLQRKREGERGVLEAGILTGVMALGVLAAGQLWGPQPDTHLLTSGGVKIEITPASKLEQAPGPGESRVLSFFDGALTFDAAALPILGSPDAQAVVVEFFDYTCHSCRDMSGDLKALKKKWPGAFSVVVLPSPLNRACNPFLKDAVKDHESACELATLALAFWRAKPAAFPEFHEYLMSLPLPVTAAAVQAARQQADALAGAGPMNEAMQSAWVSARLKENIGTFAKLTAQSIVMPKLLLQGQVMMNGTAKDAQTFIGVMEQQFNPAGAGSQITTHPK